MKLSALITGLALACSSLAAQADTFTLRMGGGHTTGLTYVNQYDTYFADEVAKRVEEQTDHKVRFIKAWGGSVASTRRNAGYRPFSNWVRAISCGATQLQCLCSLYFA